MAGSIFQGALTAPLFSGRGQPLGHTPPLQVVPCASETHRKVTTPLFFCPYDLKEIHSTHNLLISFNIFIYLYIYLILIYIYIYLYIYFFILLFFLTMSRCWMLWRQLSASTRCSSFTCCERLQDLFL